jgi:hypothetical protein
MYVAKEFCIPLVLFWITSLLQWEICLNACLWPVTGRCAGFSAHTLAAWLRSRGSLDCAFVFGAYVTSPSWLPCLEGATACLFCCVRTHLVKSNAYLSISINNIKILRMSCLFIAGIYLCSKIHKNWFSCLDVKTEQTDIDTRTGKSLLTLSKLVPILRIS